MPHLDAALDGQRTLAVRRRITGLHVADIGHHHIGDLALGRRLGQVAPPVHAGIVIVGLVGAADEVAHVGHRAVGHDAHRLFHAHRPQIAGFRTEMRQNLGLGGKAKALQPRHLAHLHLVHLVVAAQQQQPHRHPGLAIGTRFFRTEHDGFQRPVQRQLQVGRHVLAACLAGGSGFRERLGGRHAGGQQRHRLGQLDVGRIVGTGAVNQRILTGVGNHLELVAGRAANRARIGRHGPIVQPQPVEDANIGVEHLLIAGQRCLGVAVEGIGVLHGELAAAHDAEARPALVPELGLDVVEVLRQLAVAAQILPRQISDHLFRRGLDDELALVPVLHPHQLGAVLFPAAGFHPQLGRLDHRHQQLDGTGGVHLLADDGLDATNDAQPQRHVRVDAAGQFADHAGARHQLVADHLSIGGGFLEGGQVQCGGFHGFALYNGHNSREERGCTHRPPATAPCWTNTDIAPMSASSC